MTYALKNVPEVRLLLDVWEGQPLIPVADLAAGNIDGILIRINHISGGHHLDALFRDAWARYASMLRGIYFVYNPWVDGQANYTWLANNAPYDVTFVSVDVEVPYSGISATQYAADVRRFLDLALNRWKKVVVYTGGGYLQLLSNWPTNVEYWWANYVFALYPPSSVEMTWEQLRAALRTINWPPPTAPQCPGPLRLWQASGDRLKLPGMSGRAADINIFPGTLDELRAWMGYAPSPPETVELTDQEKTRRMWAYMLGNGWVSDQTDQT